jgi:hypothetical protein
MPLGSSQPGYARPVILSSISLVAGSKAATGWTQLRIVAKARGTGLAAVAAVFAFLVWVKAGVVLVIIAGVLSPRRRGGDPQGVHPATSGSVRYSEIGILDLPYLGVSG